MSPEALVEGSHRSNRALPVALAGALSLAVAMGIGRFAFTPLLPMMLHDGLIDLETGSWLATANYVGYLAGALLCMALPRLWASVPDATAMVRWGLVATLLLTLGMAVGGPVLWLLLRFLAGAVSAMVFVFTSSWCLTRLAALGVPSWGGAIYTGPGIGIVVTGLAASGMVAGSWSSATGWIAFAVIGLLLTAAVWPVLRLPARAPAHATAPGAPPPMARAGWRELAPLAFAYGLAGFGYIITATFLPVIAREALPGSALLEVFWPIFGLGVVAGALLAVRIPPGLDRRLLLLGCYLLQAVGVLVTLWLPSLAGFAIGSLLLGVPFTAISFFGMQEARHLRPQQAASFMGLMTALYGLGQIAGPPLVTLVMQGRSHAEGFALSLEIAAAALVVGAALYGWLAWAYPGSRRH